MLSSDQQIFLQLLRLGIGQSLSSDNIETFRTLSPEEWKRASDIGKRLATEAFMYHGMMQLPQELRAPKNTLFSLCIVTENIEKYYHRITRVIEQIDQICQQEGLRFCLLKGHANGVHYPHPEFRYGGDVDIYMYLPKEQKKLENWAIQNGYPIKRGNLHHSTFSLDHIQVENHWVPTYFGMRKYDRMLKKDLQNIISQDQFDFVSLSDTLSVRTLPFAFNAFFIFQHLFHHFMVSCIGLKQVMDWMYFWEKNHPHINTEEFVKLSSRYGELYAMRIFSALTVKYLGASASIYPFLQMKDLEDPLVEKVLCDILSGGNYGLSPTISKGKSSKWTFKWHSFRNSMRRMKEMRDLAPHLINPLPVVRIIYNLKLMLFD